MNCIIFIVLMNDYGHPHQEVLERLEDVGAKILRTDECGAITILVKKDRMIIKKYAISAILLIVFLGVLVYNILKYFYHVGGEIFGGK